MDKLKASPIDQKEEQLLCDLLDTLDELIRRNPDCTRKKNYIKLQYKIHNTISVNF